MDNTLATFLFAVAVGAFAPVVPVHAATTTTVESTTTQSQIAPKTARKLRQPVAVTTSSTTATTVESSPRAILSEDTLKKMSDTLCTRGFKAHVSTDHKNVCQGMASAPDIVYSCVWTENGAAAYDPSGQGPCKLDFAEHRGSVTITKELYKSSPPLAYGTEAQCCFRAAQGPASSTSSTSTY